MSGQNGSSRDAAGSSERDLLLQVWLQLLYIWVWLVKSRRLLHNNEVILSLKEL